MSFKNVWKKTYKIKKKSPPLNDAAKICRPPLRELAKICRPPFRVDGFRSSPHYFPPPTPELMRLPYELVTILQYQK